MWLAIAVNAASGPLFAAQMRRESRGEQRKGVESRGKEMKWGKRGEEWRGELN
jgi:hypothetical protein